MDKEKVKDLIDFITQEPSDDEFKRGYKYPFVSCELLNCDTQKILDYFTCTNQQLNARERKSSCVDSDLGVSNSQIYSQIDGINTNNKSDSDADANEDNVDNDKQNTDKTSEEKNDNDDIGKINNDQGNFYYIYIYLKRRQILKILIQK